MTRRVWPRRVLRVAALTVVVGAVLWYISSLPGNPALAAAVMTLLTTVGALLVWSHTDHADELEPAAWHLTRTTESTPPMSLDYRLVRIRRDLRDALERSDRPDAIHPLICDLVIQQVRQRHGVDARADPEAARAHLPPDLWHYLTHPPQDTRRRSAKELATMLGHLERI